MHRNDYSFVAFLHVMLFRVHVTVPQQLQERRVSRSYRVQTRCRSYFWNGTLPPAAWELGVVVVVAPLPWERCVSAVSEGPPADVGILRTSRAHGNPICSQHVSTQALNHRLLLPWHLQVSVRRYYFRYHGWKASEYWYSSWIISRLCVSSIHSIWMWERKQDCAESGEYNVHGFPLGGDLQSRR